MKSAYAAISEVPSYVQAGKPDIFTPDAVMLVLTWVTFFGLLIILQKFAWKPILAGLHKREEFIRDSLTKADQINVQWADVEIQKNKIIQEARLTAKGIIDESREKAQQSIHKAHETAQKEAEEIICNARQEMAGEQERLRAVLKKESASIAVILASKLIRENLDEAKSSRLVEHYIKEL